VMRPYQQAARDAVYAKWNDHRSVLLVLPTGTGKTYTAGEILRERAKAGRILWLAHRSELLDQACDTLRDRIGLGCELEKAESRANVYGGLFGGEPVVVASVQTLRGKRLERWPAESFATVVIDEAHHAAARGYRDIAAHFRSAKLLGLTATPDRGDGVGLGSVFDVCAYEYEIRTAIREGYLCPILQKQIECASLDISDVKTVAGDLAQGELEKRLKMDEVLHQIAAPLVREAGTRPTIVFTAGVAQAHALVDVLAGYAPVGRAQAIDGTTPNEVRAERIAAFRSGEVQFLINCAVLTEGFDAPETGCVAMARPTKSRSLYAQCIGRGLRPHPSKTDCLVLDFSGNAGKHRLVTPLDVLAGRPLPEDIERRAKELVDKGRPTDEALAQAEQEAIERERRADERRRREAKIKAEIAYRAQQIDPFGIVGKDDGPRATVGQINYLRALKIDLGKHVPSKGEANRLIDTIKDRRRRGLCTYNQAKVLAKHGLSPDLTFDDARVALDAIAQNHWRCPDAIRARFARAESDAAAE
jgi:superfamily II DNA or RNA helicase